MSSYRRIAIASLSALSLSAVAADGASLAALTTFGASNGYRAPGVVQAGDASGTATSGIYNYLRNSTAPGGSQADLERGLAFDRGSGEVLLVSRNGLTNGGVNIRRLSSTTGDDLGGLNPTGVTGGTFAVNAVGVGADGAIYVGNLTTNATSSAYKIYRYANSASTATVAYTGIPLAGARVGDNLEVTGSGVNTVIAAGYNNVPTITGVNGYAIFRTTDGVNFNGEHEAFAGAAPAAGDFRLGLTFGSSSSQVYGITNTATVRDTTYAAGTGTLTQTLGLAGGVGATERGADYTVIGGIPLLATIQTGSSVVRVYNMTNPSSPLLIASGFTQTIGIQGNTNGSSAVAWGAVDLSGPNPVARLYTLNTNNGIQALVFTLPEPATLGMAAGAAGLVLARRRKA